MERMRGMASPSARIPRGAGQPVVPQAGTAFKRGYEPDAGIALPSIL